jgi:hypothetical protein
MAKRRTVARIWAVVAAGWLAACLGERPSGLTTGGDAGAENGGATSGSSGAGGSTAGMAAGSGGDNLAGGPADTLGGAGAAGEGNVVVGEPVALSFLAVPNTIYAGSPIIPLKVAITDAKGRTVSTASAEIALDFGNNPAGASLLGYRSQRTVDGVATFNAVGIDEPGEAFTLLANAEGLSETSSDEFDVMALPFRRVTTGFFGGNVQSIAVADANTLFATTQAGVWKSINRGSTWTLSNFGNPGVAGRIAVDPVNPLNVYITPSKGSGSFGGPSFFFGGRSDNGGAGWRSMGDDAGSGQIGAIAVDGVNPENVYAGGPGGLFKSVDGGESWDKTSFAHACYGLTIDPIEPTTLYAYGYDQTALKPAGIFKSVNGGDDWTSVSSAPLAVDQHVYDLFATPTGVFVAGSPAKLFRSTDGGAKWEGAGISGGQIAYAKSNVQRVFVGSGSSVAVSSDGGKTFATPVSVGAIVNGIAVDPSDEDRVYVATEAGVYTSINGGATYSPSSIGMTAVSLGAVAVHPTQSDSLIVGGPTGTYRTTNGGVTWSASALTGPITAVAYDQQNPSIVYACNLGATLYKSTNGGQSWNAGVDSGGGPYCYDIIVRGTTVFLSTVGGLRKSINGGASFGDTGSTSPTYGVDADAAGTTVYVASGVGTLKSINGGTSFSPMQAKSLGTSIVIDPSEPSRIFVAMACGSAGDVVGNGGVAVSPNSGSTFGEPVGSECFNKLLGLANGSVLGASRRGFLLSLDHGVSYQDSSIGIVGEGTGVSASADGQIVYVATTLGLYRSDSGGQ